MKYPLIPAGTIARGCLLLLLITPLLGLATARQQKSPPAAAPFEEVAKAVGLDFDHDTGASGDYYLPEIMGSGAALLDYDNDGDLDVYLLQGTRLNPKSLPPPLFPRPRGVRPGNRLFRNELISSGVRGRLRFTDVTEGSGGGVSGYFMGAATGDYDGDGNIDLYLTAFGSSILLRNSGNGTFTDATAAAGVGMKGWSTSASFLDFDRDGDLDLYACNYVDFTIKGNKQCLAPTGETDYCAPAAYRPVPDRLFRNDGTGRFSDITVASGIGSVAAPGLGVVTADFDGDGWSDIFVANDGMANHLWINRRNGTFEENGLAAGAAYAADGMARAGMGVACADIDRDGDDDLLVTNLTRQGSTLYRNDGHGLFDDATIDFRLAQPSYLSTGFGVAWLDYDNDGWLDLFAANGAVTILPVLRGERYPFHQRNQLFHGESQSGRRILREVTGEAGSALTLSEVSRGTAIGDIDNDGDTDILVTNNNGPVRLLLNRVGNADGAHWIQIRLIGGQAAGARVAVVAAASDLRWSGHRTDGSYLSAGDPRIHFGLGSLTRIEAIRVVWPDGLQEQWPGLTIDQTHLLRKGEGVKIR